MSEECQQAGARHHRRDQLLSLRFRETAGYFGPERGWSNEFVNVIAEIVPKRESLRGQGTRHDPRQSHGSIQDILHSFLFQEALECRIVDDAVSKPQLFRDVRRPFLNAASDLRIERLAIESMPSD